MNRSLHIQLMPFLKNVSLSRGAIFGSILILALLAFEVFNYGTTSFALRDVLGELKFGGMYWSSILAFAFCTIDFAGIARIFTPEQGRDEPAEVYYLFGAWLLAAAFNAMLTWWGVHFDRTKSRRVRLARLCCWWWLLRCKFRYGTGQQHPRC